MAGTKIILNSGRVFDFAEPDVSDFVIEDFSKSLSLINRWNGHLSKPYSVCEHSWRVAQIVPDEFKLQALCHELAEALVGDCCSPLKYMLQSFRDMEHKLEEMLFNHFNIPYPMDKCIKDADWILLVTEARDLMPKEAMQMLKKDLKGVKPLKSIIVPWSYEEANRKWLEMYYELKELEN